MKNFKSHWYNPQVSIFIRIIFIIQTISFYSNAQNQTSKTLSIVLPDKFIKFDFDIKTEKQIILQRENIEQLITGTKKDALLIKFNTLTYRGLFAPDIKNLTFIFIDSDGHILTSYQNTKENLFFTAPEPIAAVIILKKRMPDNFSSLYDSTVILNGVHLASVKDTEHSLSDRETVLKNAIKSAAADRTGDDVISGFYANNKEYDKALKYQNRSLATDETPQKLLKLAMIHGKLKQNDKAVEVFRKLIKKYPEFKDGYTYFAQILFIINSPDLIIKMYKESITSHPDIPFLKLELASFYIKNSMLKEAETLLETVPKSGYTCDYFKIKGDLLVRKGAYKTAADEYLTYINKCPYTNNTMDLRVFISRHHSSE
ncbi:MAG: tetratricopeptide repeat protein [Deltaproteobacteria bacterium]|nr:tetratricopeptide repeat protein [Deltaproteobacteria bacterium]